MAEDWAYVKARELVFTFDIGRLWCPDCQSDECGCNPSREKREIEWIRGIIAQALREARAEGIDATMTMLEQINATLTTPKD